jgi:hypothetical protein
MDKHVANVSTVEQPVGDPLAKYFLDRWKDQFDDSSIWKVRHECDAVGINFAVFPEDSARCLPGVEDDPGSYFLLEYHRGYNSLSLQVHPFATFEEFLAGIPILKEQLAKQFMEAAEDRARRAISNAERELSCQEEDFSQFMVHADHYREMKAPYPPPKRGDY